jgi:signal transduction histidine kinase
LADSHKQIEKLNWTIQSLLNLTRMDGALVELSLAVTPVAELIGEVVDDQAHQIAARGLRIRTDIAEESLACSCDRKYLTTALSNILDNAIKYSRENGEIRITGYRRTGSTVIAVADDGAGIDPSDLPHIFERFYRASSSLQEGSGLGLSLADSIVRLHGGSIEVDSTPGSGATFSLVLPPASGA